MNGRTLLRWLARAQWRSQPGRALSSVLAVAIGVALALAIQLVNASALGSLRQAIGAVNGEADLQVVAVSGAIDDARLDTVAEVDGVETASPVLDRRVRLAGVEPGDAGATPPTLRLIGIDPFAAARVTPELLPRPFADSPLPAFEADAIYLSAPARQHVGGETLAVLTPDGPRSLRVLGDLGGASQEALAVMDIGSAQWLLGLPGRIDRIDLRLDAGADRRRVRAALARAIPASLQVVEPGDEAQRMSNLSRAYRVNLNVLALVALLTGGFIVFAAMSLAALRQQQAFSLLIVLGAPPSLATRALLGQAFAIGVAGSLLGVAGGIGLAWTLLQFVGADLGGGYFERSTPGLALDLLPIAGFAALGVATAMLGAAAPALAARGLPAMRVLRNGTGARLPSAGASRRRVAIGLALLALALALATLPPIVGLPIGAYAAIAALLFAGIAVVPTVIAAGVGALGRLVPASLAARPAWWLASRHQRQAPDSAATALAGIVASFALSSAMIVMVSSFRHSVDEWLLQVLPADVYARLPASGADIDPALQQRIRALDGVDRAAFMRATPVRLEPERPPVMLLAREPGPDGLAGTLPLTGALAPPYVRRGADTAEDVIEAFVSEAMVSRHGFTPGSVRRLSLGGAPVQLYVRGVWRDYARQTGAITISIDDYRRAGGDDAITDVAIWMRDPAAGEGALIGRLRALAPMLAQAEWRSAAEIRRVSLDIFDRSFAITYVLEAVAILVGLFGVASTYAAQSLTRTREFGMLRHLGVSRRMLIAQLAIEAAIGTTIALAWGAAIGLAIALILIERVNPQSFHWTMDIALPWSILAPSALALLVTAILTAMLATRSASSGQPIAAIRRDW
ncbi:MAG: FtsX-like permease family protein [Lautropia sp.]